MRPTLVLIVALVSSILVGCGGSDESADDVGANGDRSVAAFCERIDALEGDLDGELDGGAPDDGQLEALVAALRELDPPAPVADDFAELLDAYDVLTRLEAGDEQAAADLEQRFEQFSIAAAGVEEWTQANCRSDGN